MAEFDPQKLAEWAGGSWLAGPTGPIKGFCFDARRIEPGECFVALTGGVRDGHEFLRQAAEGGAVAAIVERAKALALPQLEVADSLVALGAIAAAVRGGFKRPVVGVTGSCGKTSTKEMLRCLLGPARTHATAGNWNNRIGVPMTLFGLNPSSQDFAVIEAGINQPGEMAALGQMIRADLNVLTNIGDAHLELLGSREKIAAEKSLLASHAGEGSPIILPADALCYPAYAALADRVIALLPEGAPEPLQAVRACVRYALSDSEMGRQNLSIEGETYQITSPSRGIANNAALAIVAAQQLGIAGPLLRERMEAWRPSADRGAMVTAGARTFYVDCYNANPSSMADALDAFTRSVSADVARFYILGVMNELGDQAIEQHTAIGRLLTLRPQDRVAFVGPHQLTEAYKAGAWSAGVSSEQMESTEKIENLKSTVAPFAGAIFLKGSRSYRLEQLLPTA